ncbi:hypothetical protein ACHAQJ_001334 [Trichoderma viride]
MSSITASAHDQALSYISNPRFHQKLVLPATADSPAVTVSYADVGFNPEAPTASRSTPTVLFMPGMFGSRYNGAVLDPVARKFGSGDGSLDRRSAFAPDVNLDSNQASYIPINHLLPFSAIFTYKASAPWVDPAYSKVKTWQMAQYIPAQAFGIWHHITPALATSGTIVTKASNLFSSSNGNSTGQERNRQKLAVEYGLPKDLQVQLELLLSKRIFQENTVGADSEALQCLRKGEGWSWGECDNYGDFVKTLVRTERQKQQSDSNTGGNTKLKIRAYFAENDAMIGSGGQQYIENCWGENTFSDVLDFDSIMMVGTDHDSVLQSIEVLEKLFAEVGGSLAH